MDTIDIRIDLGAVSLLAAGQTLSGTATVTMAVDRCALVALIQGERPSLVSGRAPVLPVAIGDIQVLASLERTTPARELAIVNDPVDAAIEAILADDSAMTPEDQHLVEEFDRAVEAGAAKVRKRKLSARTDEELRAAISVSINDGAERLGVSYPSLSAELKSRGIAAKNLRKLGDIDDEVLRAEILARGRKGAAEHFGTSIPTMAKEIARLGIKLHIGRHSTTGGDPLVAVANAPKSRKRTGPLKASNGDTPLNAYGVAYRRRMLTELSINDAVQHFGVAARFIIAERDRLGITSKAPDKGVVRQSADSTFH